MTRTFPAGLAVLSVVLFLLPLAAHTPGQPVVFKADEPAYYLAALSLVRDGDLRADVKDRERLFEEFPYFGVQNVIVSSDDGWRSFHFGKPYLYSFFAAPFAGLWGAKGMVAFNMLMLLAMIWMAAFWLRRHNPAWLADTFAAFFFIASVGWAYVYWLHPEIFNMLSGSACLFFGLSMIEADTRERCSKFWTTSWPLVISAASLAAGVYNKPMLAALGLPICFELLRRREWRRLAIWLVSATASISIFALGSVVLTGKPTAYLVDLRGGYAVHSPQSTMVEPLPEPKPLAPGEVAPEKERTAGWWWIFQVPHVRGFELVDDIREFFLGRHSGFLPYQPFGLLAILLFLAHGRRRLAGWWVFGSAFLVGVFFVVFIPFNWHGGGGFVGNRYFVMAYPAFLYLVTRISPAWLLLPFAALSGLFVGPLVLAPHGLTVPQPTLQSHVRNAPFSVLPVELGFADIPGYHGQVQQEVWLWGRKDQIRPVNEELWLLAGDRVEIWLKSEQRLNRIELEISNGVAGKNFLRLKLGDEQLEAVLGDQPTRLVLEPERATVQRHQRKRFDYFSFEDISIYRLEFEIERGQLPSWSDDPGPHFFRGASLRVVALERRAEASDVAE